VNKFKLKSKKMETFKYRNSQETFAEPQLVIHQLILNGKLLKPQPLHNYAVTVPS
jgi:hypothetical protein